MKTLFLALSVGLSVAAQNEILPIEKWRVHTGDDLRWAAPDFDDIQWQTSSWPIRHNTSMPFFAGMRWYRGTAVLPPALNSVPLAIALPAIDEIFDVFVNGVRVGTFGEWGPPRAGRFPNYVVMRVPNQLAPRGQFTIAIRRWTGNTRTNYAAFAQTGATTFPHSPEIGPASLSCASGHPSGRSL